MQGFGLEFLHIGLNFCQGQYAVAPATICQGLQENFRVNGECFLGIPSLTYSLPPEVRYFRVRSLSLVHEEFGISCLTRLHAPCPAITGSKVPPKQTSMARNICLRRDITDNAPKAVVGDVSSLRFVILE